MDSATEAKDVFPIGGIVKWLIGVLQAAMVFIASQMMADIKEATHSINELNIKMAVLIQDKVNQQDRINELAARVKAIEQTIGEKYVSERSR